MKSPFQTTPNSNQVVLLETLKYDGAEKPPLLFCNPVAIIQENSLEKIPDAFRQIEHALQNGFYVAGYLAYECGYHFEEIPVHVQSRSPLLWFGVFTQPVTANSAILPDGANEYHIGDVRFSISETGEEVTAEEYSRYIEQVKHYIREGDIYQINFTGRVHFRLQGSPAAFYRTLKKKQRAGYSAYIQTGQQVILSLSPELFFERNENTILVRPMKGTAKRGKTIEEDSELRAWLSSDEKNRAENIMIVDVLRNDLGKIAGFGSVRASSLYEVETYDTLLQMTSTVTAELRKEISYYELFQAMFPSGSITGAPKRRAMQIIHELEPVERGIYTGAIGYIAPSRKAVFNVAIRTPVLEQISSPEGTQEYVGVMGTGGGIVWDSVAEEELKECKLKAQFLSLPYKDFKLIETMLWRNVCSLLEIHLERLSESCEYFGFPFNKEAILRAIENTTRELDNGKSYKIRLLLDNAGKTEIETSIFSPDDSGMPPRVMISGRCVNSADRFLYHKTTNRDMYNEEFQKAQSQGFADVLFLNERGEVTEGAISNIILKQGGKFITPPLRCGLLNGVYRRHLLRTMPDMLERVITPPDIQQAEKVYLCNALRGMREVEATVAENNREADIR